MWRDTIAERTKRYRRILAKAPALAVPDTADVSNTIISTVARYVAAPALYAYIDWVICSAVQTGQKRLYFLARDGYLMYQAAKIYCEINGIDIDCRYLYCSRYALRIPMYHLNRADAMEYITRNGMHISPLRILRRSGLEETLCRRLAEAYFPQWDPDQELTRQELSQLADTLKQNDAFWDLCAANSRAAYPMAEKYLVQEGLLDDVPYALVDSGWIGSMQKTLGQLVEQIRSGNALQNKTHNTMRNTLTGYYWGLYDLPGDVDPNEYQAFYFTPATGSAEKCAFNNNLFEVLFSAPHGMTVGYEEPATRIVPVLSRNQNEQAALILKMEPEIMAYIKAVCQRNTQVDGQDSAGSQSNRNDVSIRADVNIEVKRETYRPIIRELFDCFMCHPTREEAEAFGRIPFSDDIFAETGGRLAEPASEEVLKSSYPLQKILRASGIIKGREHVLPWYEGSAVLSKGNTDRHLKACKKYKKLLAQKQERDWRQKV